MKKLHFACLILLCLGASLRAQQTPASPSLPVAQTPQTAPDSNTPTLKVKTQLTLEDVTVTDAKGKPVHGLTQPDFTVKEDGKPQTIKNFQEYGTKPNTQAALPKLPPNVYTNQQAVAGAYNILLFDDVIAGLPGQMLEKQQALKYLKTMPPGTQVAILKLATGLRIVQGFTSDRDLLLTAVDSLRPERVHGTYLPPEASRPVPPGQPGDGSRLLQVCTVMNTKSQMTTDALDEVAVFVSGIKGRKNLIWFTPGIPWLTAYDRFSSFPCLDDDTRELHEAYSLLTAAQVAVYPVDPRGPAPLGENTYSVQDIAKATGGVAYYGRNDLDALVGEAIATGTDYYSLSYVPPLSKSDGKYHTINVKVDRPGVHLQYREGYTALDAAQPKADKKNPPKAAAPDSEFLAAMAHGLPDATELLFGVSVLPSTVPAKPDAPSDSQVYGFLNPKLKGKPLVRYDFTYALPAGAITLAGGGPSGTRTGSFKIAVLAYDADGEPLNSAIKTSAFTIKADQIAQFLQQPSRLDIQLDLPPGKVFLRIGVLDVPSQKMGILEIPQTVAKE